MTEQNANDRHQEKNTKIYRFKISNAKLYEEMMLFADKNRFLNKNDLKDAYEKWIEEPDICVMVRDEEEMLKLHCYDLGKNTIEQKIFKSIKYYHIKNLTSKSPTNNNKAQKDKRKKEIIFSKQLLEGVKQVLQNNNSLKPSQYYEKFVEENAEIIEREKGRLEEQDALFDVKLKKMMKNQYYMMFQK